MLFTLKDCRQPYPYFSKPPKDRSQDSDNTDTDSNDYTNSGKIHSQAFISKMTSKVF